jgi:hypothetical protein
MILFSSAPVENLVGHFLIEPSSNPSTNRRYLSPPIHSDGKITGSKPSDGSGCPRCGYLVYEAEKMISKNKSWHRRCFNCSDCHRSLDSTNLCDAPNGEIYCRGEFVVWIFVFEMKF